MRETVDGHDEFVMQIAWPGHLNDAVVCRRNANVMDSED